MVMSKSIEPSCDLIFLQQQQVQMTSYQAKTGLNLFWNQSYIGVPKYSYIALSYTSSGSNFEQFLVADEIDRTIAHPRLGVQLNKHNVAYLLFVRNLW